MDLFVAGQNQSAADQPNNLADRSTPIVAIVTIVTIRLSCLWTQTTWDRSAADQPHNLAEGHPLL